MIKNLIDIYGRNGFKNLTLSKNKKVFFIRQSIGKELEVLFEEYDEKSNTYRGHSSNYILVHQESDENLCKKMKKVTYKG